MEERRINAFAQHALSGASVKLAIARNLERVWSNVLEEPLPSDLQRLIDRLEKVSGHGRD